MAIREMGSDDLLLGAIYKFLEPCDLHHLFPAVHLVATGKPGLALSQGALGRDGPQWLHKGATGTWHFRKEGGQNYFCMVIRLISLEIVIPVY